MDATKSEVIAMGTVLPAIDILAVALRFFAKHKRGSRHGPDDWLILVSLIIACGCGSLLIIGAVTAGAGAKSPGTTSLSGYEESDPTLHATKKLAVCMNWMQLWTLGTSKLSVIFFYRSIFVGRTFKILSVTMIAVVTAWTLGGFFAVAFQCASRITLLWSSAKSTKKHCKSGEPVALGFSIPDVIIDMMILCMPIYWTMKLQMSTRKRLAVCGVFLFGALTVIASIIRLSFYIQMYPHIKKIPNQLGVQTNILYWSMFEIGLSIIAACLPTLWPLLTQKYPVKFGSSVRDLVASVRPRPSNLSAMAQQTLSETALPPRFPQSEENIGLRSMATHSLHRPSEEAGGRIIVTTKLSMQESVPKVPKNIV